MNYGSDFSNKLNIKITVSAQTPVKIKRLYTRSDFDLGQLFRHLSYHAYVDK